MLQWWPAVCNSASNWPTIVLIFRLPDPETNALRLAQSWKFIILLISVYEIWSFIDRHTFWHFTLIVFYFAAHGTTWNLSVTLCQIAKNLQSDKVIVQTSLVSKWFWSPIPLVFALHTVPEWMNNIKTRIGGKKVSRLLAYDESNFFLFVS